VKNPRGKKWNLGIRDQKIDPRYRKWNLGIRNWTARVAESETDFFSSDKKVLT